MSETLVYAGIDIGGTNIKSGLVDEKGKVLFREQRPTLAEKGATPLMHLVTNIAERLLEHAADEDFNVRHLGVGSPGAVDNKSGTVIGRCPNIPGWQGMSIGENLRERLNLPIYVDNDANAMALAELRFGAASGARSVVCVTVGTGIGGAIIVDGKLWRGANCSAGELGHMTINFNGPEHAGMKGTIEGYCASSAIIARMRQRLEHHISPVMEDVLEGNVENLNIKKIFAGVKKGDEAAREIVNETAELLGIGLAGITNLLNPQLIVIGGGIVDGGGGFLESVGATIKRLAFPIAAEKLTVTRAVLGNDAGFIGAGLLGEGV